MHAENAEIAWKFGLTSSEMRRILAWWSNVQILPIVLGNMDSYKIKQ